MFPIIAAFLAGLGLFFHGLGGLKNSVQGLASRRVRIWLGKWSRFPALAGLVGFFLGGLTQSVTAVAFIVSSLVGGRLLTVPQALPVVACANLGTAVLVLVASFDIHLAVLVVLGFAGVLIAFEIGGRARMALTALFFAALLFFGLRLMKDSFAPLPTMPWFANVTATLQSSLLAAFALGAILRLFIQSSPAIAVIAITLNQSGVLSTDQVMAAIFGTGMGVGGSIFLLASNLRGVPRQITLYQALLSMSACTIAGTLFAIAHATGWTMPSWLSQQLPANPSLRLAFAFAGMQSIALLLALVTSRRAAPLLARLAPPTVEQDLARPEFIHEQALRDPESALVLAAKEQRRLLERLPLFLDTVREETATTTVVTRQVLRSASLAVSAELHSFLGGLGGGELDAATSENWLLLQRQQALVVSLIDTTHDFAEGCSQLRDATPSKPLVHSLLEGLHALTCTVIESVESPKTADRNLLLAMTTDRGEMMERLRGKSLAAAPDLDSEKRLHLIYVISLFERSVWLLRQLVQSQPEISARIAETEASSGTGN